MILKEMQEYFPLPDAWLNPSGTMFITKEMCEESILSLDMNNLKVYFLKHEAMLVLKVLSGRREDKYPDKRDTIALLRKTNIRSLQVIDALVMKYKYKWNNPYVMQFAEDALTECWKDYTPNYSTIGISDTLKKYWLLTNQSGGLTPSTSFSKNHN